MAVCHSRVPVAIVQRLSYRLHVMSNRFSFAMFLTCASLAALGRSLPASAAEESKSAPKASDSAVGGTTNTLPEEISAESIAVATLPPTWLVDDGRIPVPAATAESVSVVARGALQLRFRTTSALPLMAPLTPTEAAADSLGQRYAVHQWLRITPRIRYRDRIELLVELDLMRGMMIGQTTQWVDAVRDSDSTKELEAGRLRQLYLQYMTPVGMFRIGQQTSHWGMGLVANDGDHATTFGDHRRGTISERLLFASRPLGPSHPLELALAADLVFEDARADLLEGDRALQGVLALRWRTPRFTLGVYGVTRNQRRLVSTSTQTQFNELLRVHILDAALSFNAPVPGIDAFLFGDAEVAVARGDTDAIRSIIQAASGQRERVAAQGAAARLGVVRQAENADGKWGDFKLAIEWGYASGDADPGDGTSRRFTFNQNHNVGLVLFDHVMAWKTARAATLAADAGLVGRAAPGSQFLPSDGGVFGSTYIYPTVVIRPRSWIDLKLGAVFAQTTSDFVDPLRYGAQGNYRNYDNGDPTKHDLGVEVDAGADIRVPLGPALRLTLGTEGGVFFPGGAFDDDTDKSLPLQYLVHGKMGLHY